MQKEYPFFTQNFAILVNVVKLLKPKIRVARRWFKRVLGVAVVLGFIAGIFYLVFQSDFLIIKKVNCSVKDKTSLADEKRWCEQARQVLLGRRIFSSYSTTVVGELERKFLPVGAVAVEKKLPQTVNVQIVERKPMAKVGSPGGLKFLVDKEGVIYSEVQPESQNLKTVVLELGSELAIGQKIDLNVVSLILLEEPKISLIKYIGQQEIEVKALKDLTILFSRAKDLESQIRSLQTILQKYKIEGKSLNKVDLRYEQPVIGY